jgi:hypothetical protein
METDRPPRGLVFNKSKCVVWCGSVDPSNPDPLGCGILRADPQGLLLLGSPIGSSNFMKAAIDQRIEKTEEIILHRLPTLEDPQVQFCLLRSCLSLPKFIYSLRTCKPSSIKSSFTRFDAMRRMALEDILGASLNEISWTQASLPVSLGGMGLRSAASHSVAAFLSSIAQTEALVNSILHNFPERLSIDIPLTIFREAAGILNLTTEPQNCSQKSLSLMLDTRTQKSLIDNATDLPFFCQAEVCHSSTLWLIVECRPIPKPWS